MLKEMVLLGIFAALLAFAVGCSEDENPVNGDNHGDSVITATTTWISNGDYFQTVVDANDYDNFTFYSFTDKDTVATTAWDVAFRRNAVKLNGGSSAAGGGTVVGVALADTTFSSITITDTTGVTWVEDGIDYAIDSFYTYNYQTHVITSTRLVYSMVDAEGDNYIKFRIDSMVGIGQGDMGTVHMSYYYQDTTNSTNLFGTIKTAAIVVGTNTAYFDFSGDSASTPADPANSLEWDLGFNNFNIFQNNDPFGIGDCAAFNAFTENSIDPTDIDEFIAQPAGAPLFPDIPSSALSEWYEYLGAPTHALASHLYIYLVKAGGAVYKVQILSYYGDPGGAPTSAIYTFRWKEL